ncbi:hypothetical protein K450DRAFT_216967 [Umbelopsis ramanniana AG]|uniref:Uncharacterized protein n=1 Tax=Umbelopsis ramanniana AG TaxID=1314678 RepID=A0AAD5EIZ1_UMBRA|nr:uncharacterized protein K450DRAFT_216967 [Umbelopsis ramanniana AG]KAI8584573.1 hypothetical protein K450DRAFT_216967 [Umbelopsis ramanniana AG]
MPTSYSDVVKKDMTSDPDSFDGTPEAFIVNQVYPLLYPSGSISQAKIKRRRVIRSYFDNKAVYTDPFSTCVGPQNIAAHFDFLLFFFRFKDARINHITAKDDTVMIDSEHQIQLKWWIAIFFSVWGVIWWLLGGAPKTSYRVISRFKVSKVSGEWRIREAEEIWSVAEILNASLLPGGFLLRFLRPVIGWIMTSIVRKVGNDNWKDD